MNTQTQGLVLDTQAMEQSRGPRWYLEDTKSTSEASNASLGIDNIILTPATSQAQLNAGAIGQVALHTTIGSFYMTAFRGKKDPGSVRLAIPSRKYTVDGVEKNQDYYSLSAPVRAQILKFVHAKCKSAQVEQQQSQAQSQANPALQALAGVDPAVLMQLVAMLQGGGVGAVAGAGAVQPQVESTPSVPDVITDEAY